MRRTVYVYNAAQAMYSRPEPAKRGCQESLCQEAWNPENLENFEDFEDFSASYEGSEVQKRAFLAKKQVYRL